MINFEEEQDSLYTERSYHGQVDTAQTFAYVKGKKQFPNNKLI